ncbi:MAG: hypothetical protein EBY22_17220 [Gammaproteobacteria bacterium]|nr:hypothetical protein [Gammaproteobacteria bacterium]
MDQRKNKEIHFLQVHDVEAFQFLFINDDPLTPILTFRLWLWLCNLFRMNPKYGQDFTYEDAF